MLDWNDFRVFLTIAREHTLSGAARRLKIDQSTVGRRLTALETSVGVRLFDRTPDGYVLTAAGELARDNIEHIEDQAMAVERKLLGQDARLEGSVRLATSDSFAAWFLVRHLNRMRQRNPGVVVEIVVGNKPVNLARREADLSVRLTKPTQPNLVSRRLGVAAWALYASESYVGRRGVPNPKSGFRGHDIVGYDEELAGTAGAGWLQRHANLGRVVITSNSLLSQAAAVVAGFGVSALPCLYGDLEPRLRRLSPGIVGHHDIWMVVHPDVSRKARVRAVMDYLVDLMQKESQLLSGKKA
jgi:DNA-binding transcriptional LysR family regulator